jgi:NADH dehydrogenase [ubiquinone] 1 alpha subcomplex assembly factor 7
VHHYQRTADGWRERAVGFGPGDELAHGLAPYPVPESLIPEQLRSASDGQIAETSPLTTAIAERLAARLVRDRGAILVVDYGYTRTAPGETLQALKAHRPHDPLRDLGEADLTAHVDFEALGRAAAGAGAAVWGPVTQRDFLIAMGITERMAALRRTASYQQATALQSAVDRLTDLSPTGMGALFKVLAFGSPDLSLPPGFEVARPS